MTKPVTWEQIIDAAQSQGKLRRRPGREGRVADGVDQRPRRLRRRADRHQPRGAGHRDVKLGLDSDAGRKAAADHRRDRQVRRRRARPAHGGRVRLAHPVPGRPGLLHGQLAVRVVLDRHRRRAGHLRQVAARRHRLDDLPAHRRGRQAGPALRRDQPRRRRVQQAPGPRLRRPSSASSPRSTRPPTSPPTATRPRTPRPTTTRRCRRRTRCTQEIRDSLQQAVPRPQTPYYNEVSTGLQQTWYPPSSVNPDTTPQKSTDLITVRPARGEPAMSSAVPPAAPERQAAPAPVVTPPSERPGRPAGSSDRARSERRLGWWLAGPAFVVMLLVTAVPDPAGGLRLAVRLPPHRPRASAGFVGLGNYGVVLTDPVWWRDLRGDRVHHRRHGGHRARPRLRARHGHAPGAARPARACCAR